MQLPFGMIIKHSLQFRHHLAIGNCYSCGDVFIGLYIRINTLFNIIKAITPYIGPKLLRRGASKRSKMFETSTVRSR